MNAVQDDPGKPGSNRPVIGKRFARRAKRWAELQQRRHNGKRSVETPFCVQPTKVPTCMGADEYQGCSLISLHPSSGQNLAVKREDCSFDIGYHRSMEYYKNRSCVSHSPSTSNASSASYYAGRPLRWGRGETHWTNEDYFDCTSLSAGSSRSSNDSSPLSTSMSSQSSIDDACSNQSISSEEAAHFAQCGPPPDRHWVQREMDQNPYCHTWNNFTVLSYNILCPSYATENAFGYCPSWSLDWNYRKSIILKDIIHFEPDIIALQEVETEQFSIYFCPKLDEYGYSGVFAQKTRAKTMDIAESNRVDGCALFWRKSKFVYESHKVIEFASLAIKSSNGNEHMLNRVMPKDNVAIACVLQMKGDNMNPSQHAPEVAYTPMVICNTHMHWDPSFCDVKLIQSMILTKAVSDVVKNVAQTFQLTAEEVPLIICGDFNSLPDSAVYEYFTHGFVNRIHPELKGFNDEKVMSTINNVIDDSFCGHGLALESAVDVTHIPYTNNTADFKGVIDYIFGTSQTLLRLGFLGPIDQEWVYHNKIIGFPHAHIPSDHLPIMCHYALIPRSFQNNGVRQNPLAEYHSSFSLFS
uniref:Endo/exonuclease/phosphatase domain-containing protein n=1 Tax=Steinernema glaseri TaxID=37863 RepID=A0A1I7YZE5_9BILA